MPFAARELCSVQLLDLRWGVDTSDLSEKESSEKVLKVCLSGIEKCRPFMIIIMGDRYGWIPDSSNISDTMNEHRISADLFDKSVTELEIQYGLMMNSDADCFIYMREIDYDVLDPELAAVYRDADPRCREKLKQLKEKLCDAYPDRVRTYSPAIDPETGRIINVDSFTELVTEDIKSVLLGNDGASTLTWQEREKQLISRQISSCGDGLVYREFQVRRLIRALGENPLVVLKGEPGSGKTSLLCQMVPELKRQNYHVIPFLCGSTAASSTVTGMLQYFVYVLEEELGIEHDDSPGDSRNQTETERWQTRLTELCRRRGGNILFLIDALDQLPQNEEASRMLWAPEGLGTSWRCLASAQPDTDILREHAEVQLAALTQEERALIIDSQFGRYGKSLDRSVVGCILDMPGSRNPLYLRLVLARLLMLYRTDFEQINRDAGDFGGSMGSINHYLKQIITSLPEKTEELGTEILRHAAGLAAETVKGSRTSLIRSLELLAVSRYGIRLYDLERATADTGIEWNTLQFEWMRYFLDFCFFEQADGRINFSHKSFRSGLVKAGGIDVKACHGLLARVLSESSSDAAAGDSIWHMFSFGTAAAPLLEKILIRTVDNALDSIWMRFRETMYEFAEKDGGETFSSIFRSMTPLGKWYAAVMFSAFVDEVPESAAKLGMLRDAALLIYDYMQSPPSLDELTDALAEYGPDEGGHLMNWKDARGYELENQMIRAQLLIIAAGATDELSGTQAAEQYYRKAMEEADLVYEMRLRENIVAVTAPVYVAYINMADYCYRTGRSKEGVEVCVKGIKTLRSMNSQSLYTMENFSAPDSVLMTLMGRMMDGAGDPEESRKIGALLERAYYDAKRNYEVYSSLESLNALFHAEVSFAEFLDYSGMNKKALEYYTSALEHISTICSHDYSAASLQNKCKTELIISRMLLKEGNIHAAEYAETAERTASEMINIAPEDPRPRILLAAARADRVGVLLMNTLNMQAADLLYKTLDELEPWLELTCDPTYVLQKAEIMRLSGKILLVLDEPDTAALCFEYGIRFAEEAGDREAAADMRTALSKLR